MTIVMDSTRKTLHQVPILAVTVMALLGTYAAILNGNSASREEKKSVSPSERSLRYLAELESQAKRETIRYVPLYRKVTGPLGQFDSATGFWDLYYECEAKQNLPDPHHRPL
jgi:hypothetical protein